MAYGLNLRPCQEERQRGTAGGRQNRVADRWIRVTFSQNVTMAESRMMPTRWTWSLGMRNGKHHLISLSGAHGEAARERRAKASAGVSVGTTAMSRVGCVNREQGFTASSR